jgi:hypothetical protein
VYTSFRYVESPLRFWDGADWGGVAILEGRDGRQGWREWSGVGDEIFGIPLRRRDGGGQRWRWLWLWVLCLREVLWRRFDGDGWWESRGRCVGWRLMKWRMK